MTKRRTKRWWRDQFVASHYAALSTPEVLAGLIKHKGYDTVTFAAAVTAERIRLGGQRGVSPQMIGQLRNGRLKQCSVDLAEAIESVLGVPNGFIFSVREKSSDKRQIAKVDAA